MGFTVSAVVGAASHASRPGSGAPLARAGRVACTIVAIVVVETFVCGLAALPIVVAWTQIGSLTSELPALRLALVAIGAVPSYALFALMLTVVSPLASRLTGARPRPDTEFRIRDMEWPLLHWARYAVAMHLVRSLAGWLFRGSPLWTAYLRLNGARIGRRCYVNSLAVSDHNLLVFGDDVVIGADVHISGHTVEGGVVKTARVTLEDGVVVGVGTVIEIGVHAGRQCQIGALSFVPKHARLDGGSTYAGIPVRRLGTRAP
jgi:serine acetyltransferase